MTRALLALIGGQVAIHACMAGLRMSAPLQALREGRGEGVVGVLLALFAAAPIVLALRAGRLADKHGYHRPLRIAVSLATLGAVLAWLSTWASSVQIALLMATAMLAGAGANVSLIAIQRAAGRGAADATQLKRIFSWLGLAPALANVAGPMLAGALIDLGGFGAAYAALALLPLLALASARHVPREPKREASGGRERRPAWELLRVPGVKRLLLVNWVMSASWDAHSFLLPVLGHERGFSASAIGLILGVFAAAVTAVRLVIPLLAHRMAEGRVLAGSMLAAAAIFAIYPLLGAPLAMACAAAALGAALGCVQPMIMSTLHQLTPHERHGEAIALRSMTINAASTAMPLAFGAAGAALGTSIVFWVIGAALAAGSVAARRVGRDSTTRPDSS